jgi:hypothetical protein
MRAADVSRASLRLRTTAASWGRTRSAREADHQLPGLDEQARLVGRALQPAEHELAADRVVADLLRRELLRVEEDAGASWRRFWAV